MESNANIISGKSLVEDFTTPTPKENNAVSNIDETLYTCTIECAVRRKPNNTGLPGQDPAERNYRIGASLDSRTKGNLKGISGELEKLFMPSIVAKSANDPLFGTAVDVYWSSIGTPVPPDEPFFKDFEKGLRLNIKFTVRGKLRKERMDSLLKVEEKILKLNQWLEEGEINKAKSVDIINAVVEYDSVSDFLLLNYCLRYSKVANNFEDVNNSPKIDFYIFEKAVAIKNHLNLIDLRNKATMLYQTLAEDERKVNSVLLMYSENPKDFNTLTDKLLRIDELAYAAPNENLRKFVSYAEDENWETKYLILQAVKSNKIRNAANTTAYYYNDKLLGLTLEDTVSFINNDVKGQEYKETLLREINLK